MIWENLRGKQNKEVIPLIVCISLMWRVWGKLNSHCCFQFHYFLIILILHLIKHLTTIFILYIYPASLSAEHVKCQYFHFSIYLVSTFKTTPWSVMCNLNLYFLSHLLLELALNILHVSSVGDSLANHQCSRSLWRAAMEDKRMVLVHTHGLFIT